MGIQLHGKHRVALKGLVAAALSLALFIGLGAQGARAADEPVIQRAGSTGGVNRPSRAMTRAEFVDEYKDHGFAGGAVAGGNDMGAIAGFFASLDMATVLTAHEFFARYAGLEFELTWATSGQNVRDASGGRFFIVSAYHLTGNAATQAAPPGAPMIRIDGEPLRIAPGEQGPAIVAGRTLVPLRAVMEALGFEVGWDSRTRTAALRKQGYEVSVAIGSGSMSVNGAEVPIDAPARIMANRTMVPLRAISEAAGMDVGWDGQNRVVDIRTGHSNAPANTTANAPAAGTGGPSALEQAVRDGRSHLEVMELLPGTRMEDLQEAFEQEVIRLVNDIRREHGLAPRIYHPELARIARMRATETIEHNARHTHTSPVNGLQHCEYARAMGLNAPHAGENAVWGRLSAQDAVDSWMKSTSHRASILSRDSNLIYVGAGFYHGEFNDTAWTLWVMAKPM